MKLVISIRNDSESDLVALTDYLFQLPKNSIILLSGELGAGKTTLVVQFCKLFNIHFAQSPTYAIHHEYKNEKIKIDHFDLYRLENTDEIESVGLFEQLNADADYQFIEWSERLNLSDLPLNKLIYKINIKVNSDKSRNFELYELGSALFS